MINLNKMKVGNRYILTLRDGEQIEMTCCNKYDDYVNFGYSNWNFYFDGKYKDQDISSMCIILYTPLDVEELRQQLQANEEEIKELIDFVGYCFDLQLRGCSDTEKYEGIKSRADEILRQRGSK